MEERIYKPSERIAFYKFITSRGEWDILRQIAKDLKWNKNRIRQFNRIRAYWEGKSSQARKGEKTQYMDELINEYFRRNKISPVNVILEEATPDLEYRATFGDWDEIYDYAEGTMFFEEGDVYESPFAYVEINEDGTIDVMAGDSNPKGGK